MKRAVPWLKRRRMTDGFASIVVIVGVGILLGFTQDDGPTSAFKDRAIELYCEYDAASESQVRGCIDHVSFDEIERRYDRGEKAALHAIETASYEEDRAEGQRDPNAPPYGPR